MPEWEPKIRICLAGFGAGLGNRWPAAGIRREHAKSEVLRTAMQRKGYFYKVTTESPYGIGHWPEMVLQCFMTGQSAARKDSR